MKQKRYESENQIIKEIDLAFEKAATLRSEIDSSMITLERLCKDHDTLVGQKRVDNHDAIKNLREVISKNKTTLSRIETSKLPKLKQVLSAFRTQTLAFTNDPGVV